MNNFKNKKYFDAMNRNTSIPAMTSRVKTSASPVVKTPMTNKYAGSSILSLKIARTTNTASPAGSFPIPLFGQIHRQADYLDILESIPSGYSLVITESAGNLVFTYTEGANVIAYTVSSPTIKYLAALAATSEDKFKVSSTRLSVTPTANASVQFAEQYQLFEKNIFGAKKTNSLDIDVNQLPENFQNQIIEVAQSYNVDKTKGMLVFLNQDTTSLILNLVTSNYVIGSSQL